MVVVLQMRLLDVLNVLGCMQYQMPALQLWVTPGYQAYKLSVFLVLAAVVFFAAARVACTTKDLPNVGDVGLEVL